MFQSKYEDKIDDSNRICPYCGDSYQVESEDYSEDTREEECGECGKKFYSHEIFSVTHCAAPDCEINGDDHKWEPVKISSGHHDFCSVCGKCRPFDMPILHPFKGRGAKSLTPETRGDDAN